MRLRALLIELYRPIRSACLSWDWANRLTEVEINRVDSEYAYLADGSRASMTTGAVTTDYLTERTSGPSSVVDDGTNACLHDVSGNSVEYRMLEDHATLQSAPPMHSDRPELRLTTAERPSAVTNGTWDNRRRKYRHWLRIRLYREVERRFKRPRQPQSLQLLAGNWFATQPGHRAAERWRHHRPQCVPYANGNPKPMTDPSRRGWLLAGVALRAGRRFVDNGGRKVPDVWLGRH